MSEVREKLRIAICFGALGEALSPDWTPVSSWSRLSSDVSTHVLRCRLRCVGLGAEFLDEEGERALARTCLSRENLTAVYESLQLASMLAPCLRDEVPQESRADVMTAFLNELLVASPGQRDVHTEHSRQTAAMAMVDYLCLAGVGRFVAVGMVAIEDAAASDRCGGIGELCDAQPADEPVLEDDPFSTAHLSRLAIRTRSWGEPSANAFGAPSAGLLAIYEAQPDERRVALNGQRYTRVQFQKIYGVRSHYYWLLCNVRRVTWDGSAYTACEFMDYYGDNAFSVWLSASTQTVCV